MSHNYFGFVFAITADSMHLSLVYLVDISVTIFLFIFFLTSYNYFLWKYNTFND